MNEREHKDLICHFCQELIGPERISFNNHKGVCFIYMPLHASSHLECYLHHAIECHITNSKN